MNEATVKVLEAALAYADALATFGPDVHGDMQNLVVFPQVALENAVKGHAHMLIDRRDQLGSTLAALTPAK